MKEIELTLDKVARVDDEVFGEQGQFNWYAVKDHCTWYAVRNVGKRPFRKRVYLHRQIMGEPKGQVDHEDGDGLNCQRHNLRVATQVQNAANRGKPRSNTSGYKGVCWDAKSGKWKVALSVNRRRLFLGRFADIIQAALAYDAEARKRFGEFARLNFPTGM